MKVNLKNKREIILLFCLMAFVLGCKQIRDISERFSTNKLSEKGITTSYNKNGCVTSDGSRVGVFYSFGSKISIIDGKTGDIETKKKKEDKFMGLVCRDKDKIYSLTSEKAQNLTSKEKFKVSGGVGEIFSVTEKNRVVGILGGTLRNDDGTPLRVFVEQWGIKKQEKPKTLGEKEFQLDKFEGVKNVSGYRIVPFGIQDENKLLVMVGTEPRKKELVNGTPTRFSPEPFGFFTINLDNQKVKNLGKLKKSDTSIHFDGVIKTASTSGNEFLAFGTSVIGYTSAIAVFDLKNDKEVFRKDLKGVFEIMDLVFSNNGKYLAVAIKIVDKSDRNSRVKYLAKIFDIKNNEEISEVELGKNTPYLLDFRGAKLIVNNYTKSVIKIDTRTGEKVWETKYGEDY